MSISQNHSCYPVSNKVCWQWAIELQPKLLTYLATMVYGNGPLKKKIPKHFYSRQWHFLLNGMCQLIVIDMKFTFAYL